MSQTRTRTSYIVAADRPLVVIEVGAGPVALGGALTAETDPVVWSFLDRGLKLLPGFFTVALPEDTDLTLRVDDRAVSLMAPGGHQVTATPVGEVPSEWVQACLAHEAAIVLIGRAIGAADATSPLEATRAVHAAAKDARVLGGVVSLQAPAGTT